MRLLFLRRITSLLVLYQVIEQQVLSQLERSEVLEAFLVSTRSQIVAIDFTGLDVLVRLILMKGPYAGIQRSRIFAVENSKRRTRG